MKKLKFIIFIIILLTILIGFVLYKKIQYDGYHFWYGEIMDIQKVCEHWGYSKLDINKFKSAEDNEALRATMACDILKKQNQFIGKDTLEIRKLFGDFTGHYFTDIIPTYIIGGVDNTDTNTWQLVFLINQEEEIARIVVHKNCCDE